MRYCLSDILRRCCALVALTFGSAPWVFAQAPPYPETVPTPPAPQILPAPQAPTLPSPAEPLQPLIEPIPQGTAPPLGTFMPCESCGCAPCAAGHTKCAPCTAKTRLGRLGCILYEEICCPDPCYEGKWLALANAAFFVDPIRPVTQTRLRFDSGLGGTTPDRAEYFWAQANGSGAGPSPTAAYLTALRLNYYDLVDYTEAASGRFSVFVEMPYRSIYPDGAQHAAGFADMNLGTKTLLADTELFQITFQFRTYVPIGNVSSGLGTGHVSLEPSVLLAVNLAKEWYFQGQIAEWIPLGGDPGYAGAILHYHTSLNHTLWYFNPSVPIIGTFEFNGWSFQAGSYTDPYLGTQDAARTTYASIGPGLRTVVCEKIDFGVAAAFSLTKDNFAQQLIRAEFRWRF